MNTAYNLVMCGVALAATSLFAAAPSANAPLDDGVDRADPNFVTASLMIASPGEELFSCAGHAFIRLECPKFKLDYCFSYESEPIPDKVFSFFAGRLKMGMFAVPTEKYLEAYKENGRGVRQYRLNLSPAAKQRLWKIMDDKAAEGAGLPYDYVRRGCAWSVLGCLRMALDPVQLKVSFWPAKYDGTRREITSSELPEHPWNVFALHAIWGFETDREVTKIEKVLMPNDLLEFLKVATVDGVPVICGEGYVIVQQKGTAHASFFSPLMMASLLVLLAVGNFVWGKKTLLDWLFLGVQSVAGVFFTYLICFSSLPATSWNWLIVPFNLFPLVFWHWRRYWAWAFAAVLLAWEAFMALWPHRLTDPAYLVIVLAYIVFYAKVAWRTRKGTGKEPLLHRSSAAVRQVADNHDLQVHLPSASRAPTGVPCT